MPLRDLLFTNSELSNIIFILNFIFQNKDKYDC
nr:MAG TPA: hypothetical protein [Caudoviricetes sp.]